MQNRTLGNILWDKALDSIERSTWYDIIINVCKLFAWCMISLAVVNIPQAWQKLSMALKYGDYAIIKILLVFVVIYHGRTILSHTIGISKMALEEFADLFGVSEEKEEGEKLYIGIPVIELVDYLFTAPKYSRDDFVERYGVPRKAFEDFASAMDRIGVFVRGENNSRELSKDFSRADIMTILSRASDTGDIRPLIRKTESGYSHRPSMPEIRHRSPAFTIRPLHASKQVP